MSLGPCQIEGLTINAACGRFVLRQSEQNESPNLPRDFIL